MAHLDFKAEYEDTIAGGSGTHFDIDDVVAATGDLLIVYVHTQSSGDQPGANDCSDTQSSTYSAVVNIDSADNLGVRLWAAEAGGANPDIDIDCGAIDFYTAVAKCLVVDGAGGDLAEVAGDATDSAESTNGTVSTASITADNSPAFVVCADTCDGGTNDETTAGFTELSQASNDQFESGYVRQATAASINASFSRGGSPQQDHGAVIAAWSEAAAGGGADITATLDTFTVSELAADIALDVDIAAAVDTLTVSELAADVDLNVTIAAALDAFTVSELAAAVSLDVDISAGLETLTLSELAAVVALGKNITATVDVFALSELAADVDLDVDVAAAVDALSLTEFQAAVALGKSIDAAADSLGLTVFSADVALDVDIAAGVDTFTLTELVATVSLGGDTSISAGLETLTLVELRATIQGVGIGGDRRRGFLVNIGRLMG